MAFRRRLRILFLILLGALGVVWGRIVQLQAFEGEEWERAAAAMRTLGTGLEARRGRIVDREGVVLAEDTTVFQLAFVGSEWKRRERWRCEECGTVLFRETRRSPTPPRAPRCRCKAPQDGIIPMGEGDLLPIERLLHLPPGELRVWAAVRLEKVVRLVQGYKDGLLADGLDPFLVTDMVRTREQNLLESPYVFVSPVPEEAVRLVELDEEGAFRGFRIQTDLRRVYPQGAVASRLLGHTAPPESWGEYERLRAAYGDEITPSTRLGRAGVEDAYDGHLRGRSGRQRLARDEHGAFSVVLDEASPVPGMDVRLALSTEACRKADEALERRATRENYYLKTRPSGGFVALDAETGEILAVGDIPRFDPVADLLGAPGGPRAVVDLERGDWVPGEGVVLGIDEAHVARRLREVRGLSLAPLLDIRFKVDWVAAAQPPEGVDLAAWRQGLTEPLGINTSRVFQAAVQPGSTLKPFVGLGMLESGVPLPFPVFHCTGETGQPRCHDHSDVDFEGALAVSCNKYFAYSLRDSANWGVYRTSVAAFLDRLGFGHSTGSDLGREGRGAWLQTEEWGEDESPTIARDDGRNVAIGQGPVLVTPLQMARAAALIANGGRLVAPHVAALVGDTPVSSPARDLMVSPESLSRVREGMRRVVNGDGTARNAGFERVHAEVWGKTGTAQVGTVPCAWMPWPSTEPATHHWFVGYAKAPGRRTIAFAAVLHARTEHAAAETAAPAVADFLAWWFDREGAP